jgi:hypothetical protein
MLATVDIDGRPVVAPVPMVADAGGAPVMVVSNLSTHSSRGRRDTRAAMNVGDHLLMQGDLRPVPGIQQIELTDAICETAPELRDAVESLDWSWLRLEPTRVRLTASDGDEHWLRPADVAGAEPDPLVLLGNDFIETVQNKLADQLLLIAKTLGGRWLATSADVATVDRYGLVLEVDEPAGVRSSRVPFPDRLDSAEEVHAALGALVLAARAAARRDDVPDNPTAWPEDEPGSAPADVRVPEPENVATESSVRITPTGGTALIDGLRQAAAVTRAVGPQPAADAILLTPEELYETDGIRPFREDEHVEAVSPDEAESFDEPVIHQDSNLPSA